jgi:hypothetical protein
VDLSLHNKEKTAKWQASNASFEARLPTVRRFSHRFEASFVAACAFSWALLLSQKLAASC